jgi:hypothetical protein
MVATLGTAGAAQAATQSQSVRPASGSQSSNCFTLLRYNDESSDHITGGYLYFGGNLGRQLCQARVSLNNTDVEIFVNGTGDCLALNASTNPPTVYEHVPSGCSTGTVNYLQWKFISLNRKDRNGHQLYALQSQYVPSGKTAQCLYDNIETKPAETGACGSKGTNHFLWFGYVPVP